MQFNEKRDFLATRRSDLLTQADIENLRMIYFLDLTNKRF